MTAEPEDDELVSVCVPTYNGAEYVVEAVESALSQTYENIEVVVSDDRSTDGTYELLRAFRDSRVRLERNPFRRGHIPNRNRTIARARGGFVKFLDQDDVLRPRCIEEMRELFATDPAIGLVFCRREILTSHADKGSPTEIDSWAERYRDLHASFRGVMRVNDGHEFLGAWLSGGASDNWIGEPVAVMVRRGLLVRSGGFDPHIKQSVDIDLWLRIAVHGLVGFVDEALVAYRTGHKSVTAENLRERLGWLDRLWLLENLATDRELRAAYPAIEDELNSERRAAWRTVVKLGRGHDGEHFPLLPYLDYARFRARRAIKAR